jgi:hypothetical protein
MMLDSGARVPKNKSSVNWYAWFDGCLKNQLLVVELLKTILSNFKEGLSS